MRSPQKAFTLVELAIVITIIGLLIGGVLKGQELLQNARMTSSSAKFKSADAAVLTFKDIYKALPGDMRTPDVFLAGCTAAPCNWSGDGNGAIGQNGTPGGDENSVFWLHLAKAGLITGVDPSKTWTTGNFYSNLPSVDMGGSNDVIYQNVPTGNASYPNGLSGHYWYVLLVTSPTTYSYPIPANKVGIYDLKYDDGKPWVGDVVVITGNCAIAAGAGYDPNSTAACSPAIKTSF